MCLIFVLKKGGRLERCNGQVTKREGGAQLQNKLISRGSTWRRTGILLVTGYRTTTRCSVETLDVFIPLPQTFPSSKKYRAVYFHFILLSATRISPNNLLCQPRGVKTALFCPKIEIYFPHFLLPDKGLANL